MKKNIRRILFALILVVSMAGLAGCGKNKTKDNAVFGFAPGDSTVTLVPGERFDPAALGETAAYMEAASCYYEGLDKVFTYEGYEVTTYPAKDGDYIQDINISADNIKTPEGIGVGSTLAQVEAAYGTDYRVSGKMYRYDVDDSKYMYFFLMNDVVKYYGYATEVK